MLHVFDTFVPWGKLRTANCTNTKSRRQTDRGSDAVCDRVQTTATRVPPERKQHFNKCVRIVGQVPKKSPLLVPHICTTRQVRDKLLAKTVSSGSACFRCERHKDASLPVHKREFITPQMMRYDEASTVRSR